MPSELADLNIGDLVRHKVFQVRSKLDPRTVARYAGMLRHGGTLPPVKVARITPARVRPKGRLLAPIDEIRVGALVLVDGYHRVEAQLANGRGDISAEIVDATKTDALWLAAEANLAHGLPLKTKDLRTVFHGYIHARRYRKPDGGLKSYREIAADLNGMRSYVTFRAWMRKDFPKLFRSMGRDEGQAPGGLPDNPVWEPNGALLADGHMALGALRSAVELFTPMQRGEIIEALEATLAAFREHPVEAPDF